MVLVGEAIPGDTGHRQAAALRCGLGEIVRCAGGAACVALADGRLTGQPAGGRFGVGRSEIVAGLHVARLAALAHRRRTDHRLERQVDGHFAVVLLGGGIDDQITCLHRVGEVRVCQLLLAGRFPGILSSGGAGADQVGTILGKVDRSDDFVRETHVRSHRRLGRQFDHVGLLRAAGSGFTVADTTIGAEFVVVVQLAQVERDAGIAVFGRYHVGVLTAVARRREARTTRRVTAGSTGKGVEPAAVGRTQVRCLSVAAVVRFAGTGRQETAFDGQLDVLERRLERGLHDDVVRAGAQQFIDDFGAALLLIVHAGRLRRRLQTPSSERKRNIRAADLWRSRDDHLLGGIELERIDQFAVGVFLRGTARAETR